MLTGANSTNAARPNCVTYSFQDQQGYVNLGCGTLAGVVPVVTDITDANFVPTTTPVAPLPSPGTATSTSSSVPSTLPPTTSSIIATSVFTSSTTSNSQSMSQTTTPSLTPAVNSSPVPSPALSSSLSAVPFSFTQSSASESPFTPGPAPSSRALAAKKFTVGTAGWILEGLLMVPPMLLL